MTKKSWQGKSVRTAITMDRDLYRDVKKLLRELGYGSNFSAFVTDAAIQHRLKLLRQKREVRIATKRG